jgi:hypothetical protein
MLHPDSPFRGNDNKGHTPCAPTNKSGAIGGIGEAAGEPLGGYDCKVGKSPRHSQSMRWIGEIVLSNDTSWASFIPIKSAPG